MTEIDYENELETIDSPSSKDWKYSDFIKNREENAEWISENKWWDKEIMIVWDQFDQDTTYKGCTAYWLTSPYNWYNMKEYADAWVEYSQEDPRRKWEAYQATRWRPNVGSSLQKMMSFFRTRKLIDWNVVANGVEEMKNALDNDFYIYTGTNSCNWRETSRTGIFVYKRNGWGHWFAIIGYDEIWFIAINSFWDDRGNKGYFTIPFKDEKYLYSTNVIIDHDNTGSLQSMKDDADIQKAIELWITNWSNLDDMATRRETVLMIVRWLKTV